MVYKASDGGGGGGDGFDDKEKDLDKRRPTTPTPIAEDLSPYVSLGDDSVAAEVTPVITSLLASRFQQEVGGDPHEVFPQPSPTSPSFTMPEDDGSAVDDGSSLGAAAAAPPPPRHRRRQTPAEAARYAEVARQLNQVALQIEDEYSSELDSLVEKLNLVSNVAYDAFAAVANRIIANGITWERVLVLILFGWRVMKKVYSVAASEWFRRIYDWILKFITENVLQWICSRGGWGDLLGPGRDEGPGIVSRFAHRAQSQIEWIVNIPHCNAICLAFAAIAFIGYRYFVKKD